MKLALGTAQFGLHYGVANTTGRVSSEAAGSVLRLASQSGMDMLDTAVAYGDGESVLGALGIQSWKVITKLPSIPDDCADVQKWVDEQVKASIQRLGVKQLYCLMLHRPSQLRGDKGAALYAALQFIKAEGLAQKIGISIYTPIELETLFWRYRVDVVQAPLNILDRRLVDTGWADRLKQSGVEVHVRSVFLQGLLLMPAHTRSPKFSRWAEVLNEWDCWVLSMGLTPLQACLRYVNQLVCIDRVIVGVDSVDQLRGIIEAANGELPYLPTLNPLQDDRLINPASWSQL